MCVVWFKNVVEELAEACMRVDVVEEVVMMGDRKNEDSSSS